MFQTHPAVVSHVTLGRWPSVCEVAGGGPAAPHQAWDSARQQVRCVGTVLGLSELWKLAGPSGVITGTGALFLATRLWNSHPLPALTFVLTCLSPHLNSCHLVSSGCFFSIQTAGLCLLRSGPIRVRSYLGLAEFPLKSGCFWVVGSPVQNCPGGVWNSSVGKFVTPTVVCDSARRPRLAARTRLALFCYDSFTAVMGLLLKAKIHQCTGQTKQSNAGPT